jgi:aspartyl/asparaginyl beta-hydroxylase (cupin superfamily)
VQVRYGEIVKGFEEHLYEEVCHGLDLEAPEARRIKYTIDFFGGRKQPYLQQPKKFYFPELANIEFADPWGFDWVERLESLTDEIRKELLSVIESKQGFHPYLQGSDNRPETDGGGLKDNKDWSAYFIWEYGNKVEENAARCPTIVKFFEDYFSSSEGKGGFPCVIFSKLSPNTKIPPHNGLFNTRYICHLPLIIPDGCGFRVGNDVRKWEEGKVWIFDDSIEHEAWNNSDEDRYILLFEVWRPELTELERTMITQIQSKIEDY